MTIQPPPQPPLWLEDFEPGRVFHSAPYAVTEQAVLEFAREFDPQAYHLDHAAAARSIFGTLVAGGFHSASLCLKLAIETGLFARCGMAGVGADKLRWLRPMKPGDTVRLTFSVIAARRSRTHADRGIVAFAYDLRNQHDESITVMELTKVLRARPQAAQGIP